MFSYYSYFSENIKCMLNIKNKKFYLKSEIPWQAQALARGPPRSLIEA